MDWKPRVVFRSTGRTDPVCSSHLANVEGAQCTEKNHAQAERTDIYETQ